MGWRERDWARFNDDERRALFGASPCERRRLAPWDPAPITDAIVAKRPARVSRRRARIGEWALIVLVGLGVLAFAYDHVRPAHRITSYKLRPASPLSTSAPRIVTTAGPPPADVVAIRWRSTDLAPAAAAGRVCVTDQRHGQICASYVAGERPADTLTRQIEARGLRVQSSG